MDHQQRVSSNDIEVPENLVELQEFCDDLWNKIFELNQKELIMLYNEAAEKYNKKVKSPILIVINSKTMATAKKAATKKAAPKKVTKKAAPKKATAKAKAAPVDGEAPKKVSQKIIIAELAEQGFTIDEIVAETGIKKGNVHWYFSKLKLKSK